MAASGKYEEQKIIAWETGDVGVDLLGMTLAESQKNEELRSQWRREPQLMRLLSEYNVKRIRALFDLKGGSDGLTMSEFLYVLDRCLGMWILNKVDFFCQMIDMFRQVDVNGDESMEWEEFSTYLISMGVQTKMDPRFFTTKFSYSYTDGLDRSTHLTPVVKLLSFHDSTTNRPVMCAIERNSQMVRIWRPVEKMNKLRLSAGRTFRHDTAFNPHVVLSALFIPELDMLVTTSQMKGPVYYLSFFDAASSALLARVVSPNALHSLAWSAAMFQIYAAGDDGRAIRCYCPRKHVCKQCLPLRMGAVSSLVAAPGHLVALLIVGNTDGSIAVWDLKTNRELSDRELFAHELGVAKIVISKPLDIVLSTSLPLKGQRIAPKRLNAVLVWPFNDWLGDVETGSRALEYLRQSSGAAAKPSKPADRGGENVIGPLSKRITPRRLLGHEFSVVDVQVSDSPLVMLPHITSLDRGGVARVWHGKTLECLQAVSVYQVRLLNAKKASAFAESQRKAEQAEHEAKYNALLIAGEAGEDVEEARRTQSMLHSQSQADMFARDSQDSDSDKYSEIEEIVTARARGNDLQLLPSVSAAVGFSSSAYDGSSATAQTPASLLTGSRISYARARVRLYPDKGEGRAERLYERGLGDGNKEARVLGVARTKLTANLDEDERKQAKFGPNALASALPNGPGRHQRMSVSNYALMLRRLDKFKVDGPRSEAQANRKIQRTASQLTIQNSFGDAVAESPPSDSSSESHQSSSSGSEDSDDPACDIAKLGEAHCLLSLPPEAGGAELNPLLALGGDKLRLLAFTQQVPDLLPLIAALFVEPTLTVCTITARNVIIWDVLIGRPIRIHNATDIVGMADITAACLDARQRKLYIGDSLGCIRCLNYGALLLTASAELKQLDPHKYGMAVVHLQFVDGLNQVLSLGADGQVQLCDDNSITGYNKHTLDSVLMARLPVPDPADVIERGLPDTWDPSTSKNLLYRKASVRDMVARSNALTDVDDTDSEEERMDEPTGGPARHMLGNHTAPILCTKVDVPAVAASCSLRLLATASRGTNGKWWIILWNLETGRADGALVDPRHQVSMHLDSITHMQFLEPWPLLLTITAGGSLILWDLPPSRHAFCPRAMFKHPEGKPLSSVTMQPADIIPPARHGTLGSNLSPAARGGMVFFAGDYDGAIHRWRIPAAALLDCQPLRLSKIGRVKEQRIATTRMTLTRLQRLFRSTMRAAREQPPRKLLTESFPGGPDWEQGIVWELSWLAHSGSVAQLHVLPVDFSLLSASASGLARIWDNEGRLLGTLDTTPRYSAPLPTWASSAESLASKDDLFAKLGREADGMSNPIGFQRPDEQHDTCFGVGSGSGHPDDRTSMTHVCTRRVYDSSSIKPYLHQVLRGTAAGNVSLLAHSAQHGDCDMAVAKGLPRTERTVTVRLASSQAVTAGLLWNHGCPPQGPVLWHYRTDLLSKFNRDQQEGREYRAITILMRALETGFISLNRFRRRTRMFSSKPPVMLPPPVSRTNPANAEAQLREALEDQEDLTQFTKPDSLQATMTVLRNPARRKASNTHLPGITLSPMRASTQSATLCDRAARVNVKAHLSSAVRSMPEDKWDVVLEQQPDYSDTVFSAGLRRSGAIAAASSEPSYFKEYAALASWARKSSIGAAALPATQLSLQERDRLQTGRLFQSASSGSQQGASPFSYRRGVPKPLAGILKQLSGKAAAASDEAATPRR